MMKVRFTKKLIAMTMTILLLMAMVIPVSANGGSITVYKLGGDSSAGAVNNLTGEEVANTPAGFTPLAGAEFVLYRLPAAEVTTMIANFTSQDAKFSRHEFSIHGTTGIPTVRFIPTAGNNALIEAETTPVGQLTTNDDGVAIFSNLVDGFYVLIETNAPEGYHTAAPSLIRLPLTKSDGTHNREVHVYPKNISAAGLADAAVKTINGMDTETLTNGSIVTFDLIGLFQSQTVSSVGDLKDGDVYGKAEIFDDFEDTFAYVGDSLKVYWVNAAGEIIGEPLTSSMYRIMDNSDASSTGGGMLRVTLTRAGIDAAITADVAGFALRLDAKYIGNPGVDGAVVRNGMRTLMTAAGQNDAPAIETETGMHLPLLSITIDKRTAEVSDQPLAGVTFAVAKVPVPSENADYVLGADGTPLQGVTDVEGKITFTNLEGYTDAGKTYYLKEVATVDNYQLKVDTIAVEFATKAEYQDAAPGHFDEEGEWKNGVILSKDVTIRNYKLDENDLDSPGFSLPLTGGAGTVAFTVGGILLMLGAAIVYLNGKRRNTEK